MLLATAARTPDAIGCAKFVVFVNAPEDNPFMAGAYHGVGEPDVTLNVGISGPGVVRSVVEKNRDCDLTQLSEVIKRTVFKITRAGELIGRELAADLGVPFGIVDISLASTTATGDSVANVAKRARELAPDPPLEGHLAIPEMGRIAAQFLADTMRALVDNDAAAAREVATHDDDIDALYHRCVDRVTELAKASPDNVERAMRLLVAARYMERVGDHITNIAEDVVFVSSGEREDLNP
jgi:phosphate uptake regulator